LCLEFADKISLETDARVLLQFVASLSPLGGVGSIAISVTVCLFVVLSVCPLLYLKNYMSKLHKTQWLGPPPATVHYVMYFRCCGWRHVFTQWAKYRCAHGVYAVANCWPWVARWRR